MPAELERVRAPLSTSPSLEVQKLKPVDESEVLSEISGILLQTGCLLGVTPFLEWAQISEGNRARVDRCPYRKSKRWS